MFGVLAVSSQPQYFMETRQSGVYMVSLTLIQKNKQKWTRFISVVTGI